MECPAVLQQLNMSPGAAKEAPEARTCEFLLGGGEVCKDSKQAAAAMMKKNLPDIVENKQREVVFLPAAHLPKKARMVDIKRYEARKQRLQENASSKPKILLGILNKPIEKDLEIAIGDITEQTLIEELQKFYAKAVDKA